MAQTSNPIAPFLEKQGVLVLDGGLATELEARDRTLDDELWSARLLLEEPELIGQVHRDYLEAGADCIITASYQASLPTFGRRGLKEEEGIALLRLSVDLATEARERFWGEEGNRTGRLRPLVATSVGPYGAFLGDGSEYTGRYGKSEEELVAFHRRRFEVLAETDADLLACETIPSAVEARALLRLLAEAPGTWAWFSFSCRSGSELSDGTDLASVVAEVAGAERILAVGINCTPPAFIPSLIRRARSRTRKPIVVYPNSGERYDAAQKRWLETATPVDFGKASTEWRAAGAALVGGCCRTGPGHVRQIRASLL